MGGPHRTAGGSSHTGDTIVAIATPLGEGGIAVLRVSGPHAVRIVGTRARTAEPLEGVPTHTVHHGWIADADGRRLDEALITVMRAPRSYTGEDVVEVGVHGGSVSAPRVLRALLAAGARLADRGEFTRRAYLNGRMDLSQAESVIDLIQARTGRAADTALSALGGGIAERTLAVESRLLDLLARLEVNLDFNEDVEAVGREAVGETLSECIAELDELHARVPWGRRLRNGATVVLVGRPNVGKSSLFNALLEDDRALVSRTPGTTRDWIEAWTDMRGIPVRLVDTAGIRETRQEIEGEGVLRALRREEEADLRVVVLDAGEAPTAEDARVLERTAPRPRIVVRNKSDLIGERGSPGRAVSDGAATAPESTLATSAHTGSGVEELRARIGEHLVRGVGREPADDVVPGERHADAIRRAREALEHARRSWGEGRTEELLAGDVRDGVSALGEVTGKSVGEAVLDRIFARFCIGK